MVFFRGLVFFFGLLLLWPELLFAERLLCLCLAVLRGNGFPRGASPFTQYMHVRRLSCRPHHFRIGRLDGSLSSSVIRRGSGPVPASRGSRWYPRKHRIWSEQQPVDPTPLIIILYVTEPSSNKSYPSLLPRCGLQEEGKDRVLPAIVVVDVLSPGDIGSRPRPRFEQRHSIGPVDAQHARSQCGHVYAHA